MSKRVLKINCQRVLKLCTQGRVLSGQIIYGGYREIKYISFPSAR